MALKRVTLFAVATLLATSAAAQDPLADAGAPPPWTPGYVPVDRDERGLWQRAAEAEDELRHSRLVITDPALNGYVREVLCSAVGTERCAAVRLYIVRSATFNAAMAPNGLMVVNSGALLRLRNEAELASVLGHEFVHFEQRHSLRAFRDLRNKTDLATWFAFVPYVGLLGQTAAIGAIFSFNREMERDADIGSVSLLVGAGYRADAAPTIWRNLYDEADATARARNRRNRAARPTGFFATHPATLERLNYLTEQARAAPGNGDELGTERFRQAMAQWWPLLIDDQIKLNDFGATDFLLQQRGRDGWTDEILFARGELYRTRGQPGDFELAVGFYQQAIDLNTNIAEVYRGHGLALLRLSRRDDARASLTRYLTLRPEAPDRALIASMAGGES